MLKPMQLDCGHSVCDNCVQTVRLVDQDDCPVCYDPMGVPVSNLTLAAHIDFLLATDETKEKMRHEEEPLIRKRQCLERPLPAYAAQSYFEQAKAADEASSTYKALCSQEEDAFATHVEDVCAQVRDSAATLQSQFRTKTAAAIEMMKRATDKARIHALQAGFHQQGAPAPLPEMLAPLLDIERVKTGLAATWTRPPSRSYVLYFNNEYDGQDCQSPPLAADTPADVVRMLLSKAWKDPAVPSEVRVALEEIYSGFMTCNACNMVPRHLRRLSQSKGRYIPRYGLASGDMLLVTTLPGTDMRGDAHIGAPHLFTMEEVATKLLGPAESNGTWMRLQTPVVFSSWSRDAPLLA